MSGFLDSKERVIDMVLTDTGKSLLLMGDLQFVYWTPFDDEVDYDPPAPTPRLGQTQDDRRVELTETPLIKEATMGYKGLNLRSMDTTNVYRPMFSAPPGIGQSYPLPQLMTNVTGTQVQVKQSLVMKYYGPDSDPSHAQRIGVKRYDASLAVIEASYDPGSYPAETQTEGFLITVYQSGALKTDPLGQSIGGFQEVLHNLDSSGSIAYLNDLRLINYTP